MNRRYIKGYILEFLDSMRPLEGDEVDSRSDFGQLVARAELGMNRPIIELFEKAGMDYRSSNAWLALVGFIADVLLHKGKNGRPPKWKRPSKAVLTRDFVACCKDNPRLNGEQIVKKMKERFPRKYGEIPPLTILKWIGRELSIKEVKDKAKGVARAKKSRRNSATIFA